MKTLMLDLHTHLLERQMMPAQYWRYAMERRLDVIAISEHSWMNPSIAYALVLEQKPSNVLLIPAMELETNIGHVLAYGRNAEIYEIPKFMKCGIKIKQALRIADKENVLLSISHPWGFSYDSAAYIIGEKKLGNLVENNGIGIEAYNGMFGFLGFFFYDSNWIRKPLNFLDFLEKSRIARKTGLSRIGRRFKKKLDEKAREIIERCAKPIELGNKAEFITAGSDAHSAKCIGSGIMKVKVPGNKLDAEAVLNALREKRNVLWTGPYVREKPHGIYEAMNLKIGKAEWLMGLHYAAKGFMVGKIKRKIKRRKKKRT